MSDHGDLFVSSGISDESDDYSDYDPSDSEIRRYADKARSGSTRVAVITTVVLIVLGGLATGIYFAVVAGTSSSSGGGDDAVLNATVEVPTVACDLDVCGVCNGDGTSCKDCAGVLHGSATADTCGVCSGSGACTTFCAANPTLAEAYTGATARNVMLLSTSNAAYAGAAAAPVSARLFYLRDSGCLSAGCGCYPAAYPSQLTGAIAMTAIPTGCTYATVATNLGAAALILLVDDVLGATYYAPANLPTRTLVVSAATAALLARVDGETIVVYPADTGPDATVTWASPCTDACNVHGGDGGSCQTCGPAAYDTAPDACGECWGLLACADCGGVLNGPAVVDDCGVCNGTRYAARSVVKYAVTANSGWGLADRDFPYSPLVLGAPVVGSCSSASAHHDDVFMMADGTDCRLGGLPPGQATTTTFAATPNIVIVVIDNDIAPTGSGALAGTWLEILSSADAARVFALPYGTTVHMRNNGTRLTWVDTCGVCLGNGSSCNYTGPCNATLHPEYGDAVVSAAVGGVFPSVWGPCGDCTTTNCTNCDYVTTSGSAVDVCGVCGGDTTTCQDCAGVPNGNSVLDNCTVCGGDSRSCCSDNGTHDGTTCVCDGNHGGALCDACNTGWAGVSCDTCVVGYYGANCTACPACTNGTCNDTLAGSGVCICDEGWTGTLCETCIEGFPGLGVADNCGICYGNNRSCCNDKGSANSLGVCVCDFPPAYGGEFCEGCLPGAAGPSCYPCGLPICYLGYCDDGSSAPGAECICPAGWTTSVNHFGWLTCDVCVNDTQAGGTDGHDNCGNCVPNSVPCTTGVCGTTIESPVNVTRDDVSSVRAPGYYRGQADVSHNGRVLIVGNPDYASNTGRVSVFIRNAVGMPWSLVRDIVPPAVAGVTAAEIGNFGAHAALAHNATVLVVAALQTTPPVTGRPRVRIYVFGLNATYSGYPTATADHTFLVATPVHSSNANGDLFYPATDTTVNRVQRWITPFTLALRRDGVAMVVAMTVSDVDGSAQPVLLLYRRGGYDASTWTNETLAVCDPTAPIAANFDVYPWVVSNYGTNACDKIGASADVSGYVVTFALTGAWQYTYNNVTVTVSTTAPGLIVRAERTWWNSATWSLSFSARAGNTTAGRNGDLTAATETIEKHVEWDVGGVAQSPDVTAVADAAITEFAKHAALAPFSAKILAVGSDTSSGTGGVAYMYRRYDTTAGWVGLLASNASISTGPLDGVRLSGAGTTMVVWSNSGAGVATVDFDCGVPCDGSFFGTVVLDYCGVCGGDSTGCCGPHGTGGPDGCVCDVGWEGGDCDRCAPLYGGDSCTACPVCVNGGTCNPVTGACVCVGPYWAGTTCATCIDGYPDQGANDGCGVCGGSDSTCRVVTAAEYDGFAATATTWCGLDAAGVVSCAGAIDLLTATGQEQSTTTTPVGLVHTAIVANGTLPAFVHISAGADFFCLLDDSGAAYVMGNPAGLRDDPGAPAGRRLAFPVPIRSHALLRTLECSGDACVGATWADDEIIRWNTGDAVPTTMTATASVRHACTAGGAVYHVDNDGQLYMDNAAVAGYIGMTAVKCGDTLVCAHNATVVRCLESGILPNVFPSCAGYSAKLCNNTWACNGLAEFQYCSTVSRTGAYVWAHDRLVCGGIACYVANAADVRVLTFDAAAFTGALVAASATLSSATSSTIAAGAGGYWDVNGEQAVYSAGGTTVARPTLSTWGETAGPVRATIETRVADRATRLATSTPRGISAASSVSVAVASDGGVWVWGAGAADGVGRRRMHQRPVLMDWGGDVRNATLSWDAAPVLCAEDLHTGYLLCSGRTEATQRLRGIGGDGRSFAPVTTAGTYGYTCPACTTDACAAIAPDATITRWYASTFDLQWNSGVFEMYNGLVATADTFCSAVIGGTRARCNAYTDSAPSFVLPWTIHLMTAGDGYVCWANKSRTIMCLGSLGSLGVSPSPFPTTGGTAAGPTWSLNNTADITALACGGDGCCVTHAGPDVFCFPADWEPLDGCDASGGDCRTAWGNSAAPVLGTDHVLWWNTSNTAQLLTAGAAGAMGLGVAPLFEADSATGPVATPVGHHVRDGPTGTPIPGALERDDVDACGSAIGTSWAVMDHCDCAATHPGSRYDVCGRCRRVNETAIDDTSLCAALRPIALPGIGDAMAVSADGTVYTWGGNRQSAVPPTRYHGTMGLDYYQGPYRWFPDMARNDTSVWVDDPVLGVISGGSGPPTPYFGALTDRGRVFAWGVGTDTSEMGIGDGMADASPVAQPVPLDHPPFRQSTCANSYGGTTASLIESVCCGVTFWGDLWCWGSIVERVPVRVQNITGEVLDVALLQEVQTLGEARLCIHERRAGGWTDRVICGALVRSPSGSTTTWGADAVGRVSFIPACDAQGALCALESPSAAPGYDFPPGSILGISAAHDYACVVLRPGTVLGAPISATLNTENIVCWGENTNRQLGNSVSPSDRYSLARWAPAGTAANKASNLAVVYANVHCRYRHTIGIAAVSNTTLAYGAYYTGYVSAYSASATGDASTSIFVPRKMRCPYPYSGTTNPDLALDACRDGSVFIAGVGTSLHATLIMYRDSDGADPGAWILGYGGIISDRDGHFKEYSISLHNDYDFITANHAIKYVTTMEHYPDERGYEQHKAIVWGARPGFAAETYRRLARGDDAAVAWPSAAWMASDNRTALLSATAVGYFGSVVLDDAGRLHYLGSNPQLGATGGGTADDDYFAPVRVGPIGLGLGAYDGFGTSVPCASQPCSPTSWNGGAAPPSDGTYFGIAPQMPPLVHVAAGSGFFCGLRRRDRRAVCWGLHIPFTQKTPADAFSLDDQAVFDAAFAAQPRWRIDDEGLTYALPVRGQAYVIHPIPRPVPDHPPFASLSCGDTHVCATTQDDRLFCWGTETTGLAWPRATYGTVLKAPTHIAEYDGLAHTVHCGGARCCILDRWGTMRCQLDEQRTDGTFTWGNNTLDPFAVTDDGGTPVTTSYFEGRAFDALGVHTWRICGRLQGGAGAVCNGRPSTNGTFGGSSPATDTSGVATTYGYNSPDPAGASVNTTHVACNARLCVISTTSGTVVCGETVLTNDFSLVALHRVVRGAGSGAACYEHPHSANATIKTADSLALGPINMLRRSEGQTYWRVFGDMSGGRFPARYTSAPLDDGPVLVGLNDGSHVPPELF